MIFSDDPDRPWKNAKLTEASEESCERNLLEYCISLTNDFEKLVTEKFASRHTIPNEECRELDRILFRTKYKFIRFKCVLKFSPKNNLARHRMVKEIMKMMKENRTSEGISLYEEFERVSVIFFVLFFFSSAGFYSRMELYIWIQAKIMLFGLMKPGMVLI